MTKIDKCLFCETEMNEEYKDFHYTTSDGIRKIIKDVPTDHCLTCKQYFYKQETLDKINTLKKNVDSWEDI